MSWASGRQALIVGILAVVLLLALGGAAFLVLHKAPSCTDGKMNQDEEGIDCGGSCTYLCTARLGAPEVTFVRALRVGTRIDVIAYIENPNDAAARAVPYTVELYGADRTLLAEKSGTLDIPPRGSGVTPLYISNMYSGTASPSQTFLSFETTPEWYQLTKTLPTLRVDSPTESMSGEAPRVMATVHSDGVETLRRMRAIAVVFDTEGNAIAASQTVLPDLLPLGSADAVFTWNEAFSAPVGRIDVRPVLSVPAP